MPPTQARAKCRIALFGDRGNANIHVDTLHWSWVRCLSRSQNCRGGTELCRHLASNTERASINDVEAPLLLGSSAEQWIHDTLTRDTVDLSKWELTMCMPMRFDRLIVRTP